MDWGILVQALAPIVAPIIVALLAYLFPNLADGLKPILASGIGATQAWAGGADPTLAGAIGLASVGVREIVNQNVTQRLAPKPPNPFK